ncbi:zinc ABC transporter substrate-binding protein AztC [Devosia sp. CAU 1758]
MTSRFKRLLACSVISLGAAVTPGFAQDKMAVAATFSIIGDFASQVGGDRIELKTLVGADGDAHVYEPKPSDAIALARADVVLVNGLMFEGFLSRLIEASGTTAPIIELTEGVDIVEDPLGGHYHFVNGEAVFHAAPFDPHAWQAVRAAQVYVGNIADAFCAADADGCETYWANAAAYTEDLSALDGEVRDTIAALPENKRVVVVAHHAFRYFEDEYGITFLSPQGVSTESEASAADVAGLIRQVREQRASAVFAENISDARLVEQIATEAGLALGGVLYSDALSGPDGPAPTYIDLIRTNVATITAAVAAQ